MQCPRCRSHNPEKMRFCGHCGARLEDRQPERRRLTVLFIDLVGSTSLSDQLDPEDFSELLRDYQSLCAGMIERFEGHVAQYLGDGLLVYFGYPQAHEDDARRAVLSALAVLDAVAAWSAKLERRRGLKPSVRIGIHTGLVVTGAIGASQETLALGQTPNVAARLQSFAEPDTALCSAATYDLVRNWVEALPLGPKTVRGLSHPVEIYQVLRETDVTNRLETLSAEELTPQVGRRRELEILWRHFCEARAGRGGTVFVTGEAGIGKSRLLHGFRERLGDEPYTWSISYGSPYHRNTPFYPLARSIAKIARFASNETPAGKLHKLESMVRRLALPFAETLPALASVLALRSVDKPRPDPPRLQKEKTVAALLALWSKLAEDKPLVLVVEDLHWVDPSTLETLNELMRHVRRAPILVVLSARSSFTFPGESGAMVTETLRLDRFRSQEVEALVLGLTRGRPLPGEVLGEIVAKTDGVPLFVEELTKMVLESELLREGAAGYELTCPLPPLAIPETLQESLMARLDRHPDVRPLAELCAVLGRKFRYELLGAVAGQSAAVLEGNLRRLVETGVLYQRGVPPRSSYIFRHALIQEIAYQSLLFATRQEVHRKLVRTLEERFPERVRSQPEVLAHHAGEGRLAEKAIEYWQAAAARALEQSAYVEAASHLERGCQLLDAVSEPARRDELELALLTTLGPVYMANRGFGSSAAEKVYGRARELCRKVGDAPSQFPVMLGLFRYYGVRADWPVARELGEELLSLAEEMDRPQFLLEAMRALGGVLFHLGEFREAHRHLAQSRSIHLAHGQDLDRSKYALHPGLNCFVYLSLSLVFLGDMDEARDLIRQAVELGRELDHSPSLAFALGIAATIEQVRGDAAAALRWAEESAAVAREHRLPTMGVHAQILGGWARVIEGDAEGLAEIQAGLAAWERQGAGATRTYMLGLLAEALYRTGRREESLKTLDEALARVEANGERFYEAELHRFRGVYLGEGAADPREAETSLRRALAVARRQGARFLELRAALALTRLEGGREGAEPDGPILVEALAKLSADLDVADVREAGALLEHRIAQERAS